MNINREELAWCAGFFDGEGHVRRTVRPGRSDGFQINIRQIDPEVLDRFREAVGGLGSVGFTVTHTRPLYQYQLYTLEKVQAVVAMIWPWLSPVKRAQARSSLAPFV